MTDTERHLPSQSAPISTRVLVDQLRELDEFERDLSSSALVEHSAHAPLRLGTADARTTLPTRRWWMSLGGIAVAASLLIIFLFTQRWQNSSNSPIVIHTTPSTPDSNQPNTPTSETRTAHTTEPSASVLLTIVEGSDPVTGLPCASCRTVDLVATDGREQTLLAHAGPEMIQAAMNRTCSPSARRVVVVGLSGPARSLPSNESQATQLAQCIMAAPGAGSPSGDAAVISNAAAACMPENVAVQVWAGSR